MPSRVVGSGDGDGTFQSGVPDPDPCCCVGCRLLSGCRGDGWMLGSVVGTLTLPEDEDRLGEEDCWDWDFLDWALSDWPD